jgi:predicted ATP-grasp superfamily ATP-dependent carboligase
MSEALEFWEQPQADVIYLFAGWRQWADAGSVSSGLPRYLIKRTGARQIGSIRPEGFYIFQFPGTHDLMRPVVKFADGYPISLDGEHNEFFYAGDAQRGMLFFIGDEPHLDIERYTATFLEAATRLGVKRIITFGGVYGELPYDKERTISCIYSQKRLKDELDELSVKFSDYHGGASIGSYLCKRASEKDIELLSFYAFVPTYDFDSITDISNSIRIENDFMAWLGIMRRVNYLLKLDLDLSDLEKKSDHLVRVVDDKINELDQAAPQLGVRAYINRISEEFSETPFTPLDDVWEDEIRRLFDKYDSEEP